MRRTRCGRLRPDGGQSAMNAAGKQTDSFYSFDRFGGRARTPGAAGAPARP
ncbi:hypothetical protein G3I18_23990, partial [Actinospica acidiphila]|nr:hypothetical protein [Actinospica acidiphila]